MRFFLEVGLKPIIVIIILLAAACGVAWAKMGLNLDLGLGAGSVTVGPSCGAGYTSLTGSDSNTIRDSTGRTICCPN